MAQTEQGHYVAQVSGITAESITATAQAQRDGLFLGEKTVAVNLPMPRSEMDNIELDRKFLRNFAKRLDGKYFDADNINEDLVGMFEAATKGQSFSHMVSVWPRWPLLLALCLILSLCWFTRRAIGLV